MEIFWIAVMFVVSLAALVKGADWFLESSEKIGLSMGISPFVIGVTLVAAGTSFPELISSFAAIWKGASELVVANAVGSNVANILLVVGFVSVYARKITVEKDLIDLDLPLLALSMIILVVVSIDSEITKPEAIILFANYVIYLLYVIFHKRSEVEAVVEPALESHPKEKRMLQKAKLGWIPRISSKDLFALVGGALLLLVGANFLIESVVELSVVFNIGVAVIGISAVAIGTSLPELFVSIRAAGKGKPEIAIGNIFGSNIFNTFVVVGLPGMFYGLPVDTATLMIGIPMMVIATIIYVISGTSKTIYIWEGAGYLSLYILFIAKLFDLF
jgi:cation:H+ antiporter